MDYVIAQDMAGVECEGRQGFGCAFADHAAIYHSFISTSRKQPSCQKDRLLDGFVRYLSSQVPAHHNAFYTAEKRVPDNSP
jgi:hypothetical protein